jgi:predicted phage terminase large subunit-like protein
MTKADPELQKAAAAAARRTNLLLFAQTIFGVLRPGENLVAAPYLETLCCHLQEVAEGRDTRLLVTLPPRYLKSIMAAVIFPAWVLGRDPSLQIMVACYSDKLAKDHSLMFRRLVTSGIYRATFPSVVFADKPGPLHEYRTPQNGGRRAVTLGGTVTGLGADMIIADDLLKASEVNSEARRSEVREFFDGTLMSRFNDKRTGSAIVIQQRLHQDDLPAHLLEKEGYVHLNLPAIASQTTQHRLYHDYVWHHEEGHALCPEREDLDTLAGIRRDLGAAYFEAQYLQNPAAAGSSMLDLSRLKLIDGDAADIRFLKVIQTWDTAVKDTPDCDYNVCATFGWDGERWILADMMRQRLGFGDLKARAIQLRKQWNAEHVFVETSANGSAMVQDLRKSGFLEFITIPVNDPKTARFAPAAEWLQDGRIGILHQSAWYPDLRRELLSFPEGRFDDQVDAISLFVKRQRGRRAIDPSDDRPGVRLRNDQREERERLEFEYGAIGRA